MRCLDASLMTRDGIIRFSRTEPFKPELLDHEKKQLTDEIINWIYENNPKFYRDDGFPYQPKMG